MCIRDSDDSVEHKIVLGRMAGSNSGSSSNDNPRHSTVLAGYSVDWSGGTRLANEGFLMFHSGGGWTGNQRHWALTNAYDMGGTGGPKFGLLLGDDNTTEPTLGSNGALGTNTSVATYWKNTKEMVHNGAATFAGNVTMTSSGSANSPTLAIDNPDSNAFNHGIEVFGANMTTTETQLIMIGKEGSTKNSGYIGYNWVGAGSDSNYITFGHWGADHQLKIYGSGNATFSGDVTINSGSTSYLELGNDTGNVSNDGSWNARLNVAGTNHARIDVRENDTDIIATLYAHTGHDASRVAVSYTHLTLPTKA